MIHSKFKKTKLGKKNFLAAINKTLSKTKLQEKERGREDRCQNLCSTFPFYTKTYVACGQYDRIHNLMYKILDRLVIYQSNLIWGLYV